MVFPVLFSFPLTTSYAKRCGRIESISESDWEAKLRKDGARSAYLHCSCGLLAKINTRGKNETRWSLLPWYSTNSSTPVVDRHWPEDPMVLPYCFPFFVLYRITSTSTRIPSQIFSLLEFRCSRISATDRTVQIIYYYGTRVVQGTWCVPITSRVLPSCSDATTSSTVPE